MLPIPDETIDHLMIAPDSQLDIVGGLVGTYYIVRYYENN